jgi:D-arabinose 1-dehydrogenase-like Zn-dependent alcohol dehydrogenase
METVPVEELGKDSAMLKTLTCGVCRTDLHIVEASFRSDSKSPFRDARSFSGVSVRFAV